MHFMMCVYNTGFTKMDARKAALPAENAGHTKIDWRVPHNVLAKKKKVLKLLNRIPADI